MKIKQKIGRILKRILPESTFRYIYNFYKDVFKLNPTYRYYVYCCKKYEICKNLICYESHNGAGMICNPYALFSAFEKRSDFSNFHHVWIIQDADEAELLKRRYHEQENVTFILRNSLEFTKILATAGYFIENTSFPFYFSKRKGQIYVNTWHSITVKTLGYDTPEGNIDNRNMIRNLLQSDFILSPNSFMTNIFLDAFKLKEIYSGKIIEEGYPRNDAIHVSRESIIDKLSQHNVLIDSNKKIILYAPTWRGKNPSNVENNISEINVFVDKLLNIIDSNQYNLLIKPHPFVYKALSDIEKHSGKYIPQSIDTNELLSVVDILISDYSSIFFDFLVTEKPILFYLPDLKDYEEERGIYFKPDELPGPVTDKIEELGNYISNIENTVTTYKKKYMDCKEWACKYEDGHVSERILDLIFNKNEAGYNIKSNFHTGKKRVLIYGGGFAMNGVTTSLISMLNQIDYSQFDISVLCYIQDKENSKKNILSLHKNVRVLLRCSSYPVSRYEAFQLMYLKKHGFSGKFSKLMYPKQALERDYYRCMGDADFDYIIDFSGYGIYFPLMLLENTKAKHFIWQHNDLKKDLLNKKKRNLLQYSSNTTQLNGLCSLYEKYDKIISSSKALYELNKTKLSTRKTVNKFTYVTNTLNLSKITSNLKEAEDAYRINGSQSYTLKNQSVSANGNVKIEYISLGSVNENTNINFVTIGRLAPEKNHRALITAFHRIYQENNQCRLFIIGDGNLKKGLLNYVKKLHLDHCITFTGTMENPFKVLKYCHCFVFPSLYEGQGLVVLEARILKLPIIVSNYDAVSSVCVPNGQLFIGHSADEIYFVLKAYLDGKVQSNYQFDGEKYNKQAYEEFEQLFDV